MNNLINLKGEMGGEVVYIFVKDAIKIGYKSIDDIYNYCRLMLHHRGGTVLTTHSFNYVYASGFGGVNQNKINN